MTTIYEIPLTPQSQVLFVALSGTTYRLSVTWRKLAATWFLDIADSSGNPLVSGIALVTGADLLGQYAYLGIGGQLRVATDGDVNAVPTYENLGVSSHLYFIPTP
jgi:hypothetical protein